MLFDVHFVEIQLYDLKSVASSEYVDEQINLLRLVVHPRKEGEIYDELVCRSHEFARLP